MNTQELARRMRARFDVINSIDPATARIEEMNTRDAAAAELEEIMAGNHQPEYV